jgi:carbon storage regulator CsrA
MLVLTRKYQEKIRIGNGITITVLRAKGKAVRLGIEAPADVPVIRGELAFDHPPIDGDVEDSVASVEAESEGRRGTRRARQAPLSAKWEADTDPRAAGRSRDGQPARQVAIGRVSREKAAEILPQLLSGNGPLREMLNQRSSTL